LLTINEKVVVNLPRRNQLKVDKLRPKVEGYYGGWKTGKVARNVSS